MSTKPKFPDVREKNKMEDKASVPNLLQNFGHNTTAHGFGALTSSTSIYRRIIWFIFIGIAFGMLCYQLSDVIVKFKSYPKSTAISLEMKRINFPSITVCNLNLLRNSAVKNLNESSTLKKFFDKNIAERDASMEKLFKEIKDEDHDQTEDESEAEIENEEYDYEWEDYWSDYDEEEGDGLENRSPDQDLKLRDTFRQMAARLDPKTRKELGHQKEAFIIKCSFMGLNCSERDFEHTFSFDYGNCYTFNSAAKLKKPKLARRVGHAFGLHLTLNLQTNEYMPFQTTGYGARFVIHDFGTLPFAGRYGQSIAAGFETSVGLRLTEVKRLNLPYGNCTNLFPKDIKGKTLVNDKYQYSQQGCEALCREFKIIEKCLCREDAYDFLYSDYVRNYRPCNDSAASPDFNCTKKVKKLNLKGEKGYECDCHQACEERSYQRMTSINQWPSKSYLKFLLNAACTHLESKGLNDECHNLKLMLRDDEDLLLENFAKFTLYFQDLNYQFIEEKPAYEVPNFLSDIGGTLGLWAGFSVLTGAEIVMLIFTIFKHSVRKCRVDKKPNIQTVMPSAPPNEIKSQRNIYTTFHQ